MPVFNHVASGIATSASSVKYFWSLSNPAIPGGINVDVANSFHQEFTSNGNTANDTMRQQLLGDNGSAQESNVWGAGGQHHGDLHDQVDPACQPGLHSGLHDHQQQRVNADSAIDDRPVHGRRDPGGSNAVATVIVPRPYAAYLWQGVGYIARQSFCAGAFSEAYIIAGGLASSSLTSMQGGSGTGDPNNPNYQPGNPNGNQTSTGDPVNVANGDVSQDETDITLPGIGLSLTFTRRYDSQNTADVGLEAAGSIATATT